MLLELSNSFFDQPSFYHFNHYESVIDNDCVKSNNPILFYQMHTRDEDISAIPIIPDGCMDIVFIFSDNDVESYIVGATETISGCDSRRDKFVVGVKFSPGDARNYFPISSGLLSAKQQPLRTIYDDCETLHKNIMGVRRFNDQVDLIQNYLTQHYLGGNEKFNLVNYCVKRIICNHGNMKIADLCDETGYTDTYILRLFYEYVGLRPKQFSEIVRLYNALRHLLGKRQENFAETATMFGYVDQSHMNKHFHKYLHSSIQCIQRNALASGSIDGLSRPYYF
ncbi:MAG: helix-turn-helix domain-containing protein [Clostridiales Family XIII bacterium]|nr:helix-turn-helix domain-containing protein [Clostridiales Family XIII bacterium]